MLQDCAVFAMPKKQPSPKAPKRQKLTGHGASGRPNEEKRQEAKTKKAGNKRTEKPPRQPITRAGRSPNTAHRSEGGRLFQDRAVFADAQEATQPKSTQEAKTYRAWSKWPTERREAARGKNKEGRKQTNREAPETTNHQSRQEPKHSAPKRGRPLVPGPCCFCRCPRSNPAQKHPRGKNLQGMEQVADRTKGSGKKQPTNKAGNKRTRQPTEKRDQPPGSAKPYAVFCANGTSAKWASQ